MERKNSQQSQHGKQESSSVVELNYNIPPEISDLQNNIQVKIADLGNACYDVRKYTTYIYIFVFLHLKLPLSKYSVSIYRIIISLKIYKHDNIVQLKYYWVQIIHIQQIFGVRHV